MVIWLYLGVIQKKSDVVALAKVSWSSAYAVTLAEGRITLNYSSYFDFWGIIIHNDNNTRHTTNTTIKNTQSNSTSIRNSASNTN